MKARPSRRPGGPVLCFMKAEEAAVGGEIQEGQSSVGRSSPWRYEGSLCFFSLSLIKMEFQKPCHRSTKHPNSLRKTAPALHWGLCFKAKGQMFMSGLREPTYKGVKDFLHQSQQRKSAQGISFMSTFNKNGR